MENVSSEEELLKLRNEGKISKDEYEQLLSAMKSTARINATLTNQDQSISAGISILAVLSFVFSILAVVLTGFVWLFVIFFPFVLPLFFIPLFHIPGIILGRLARRQIKREPAIQGNKLAAAGLIIGYTIFALSLAGFLFLSFVCGYRDFVAGNLDSGTRPATKQAHPDG